MTTVAPAVESILAALDESDRAPLVLATAVMMAGSLGAQLFLVRVVELPPDIPPAAHKDPDKLESLLVSAARAELHTLMESHPGTRFGPPIVVVDGDPWRVVVDTARGFDVDLVVVGSHRHHGALDRALGTVAAKVVNHADRNVLVVHQKGADRATPA